METCISSMGGAGEGGERTGGRGGEGRGGEGRGGEGRGGEDGERKNILLRDILKPCVDNSYHLQPSGIYLPIRLSYGRVLGAS